MKAQHVDLNVNLDALEAEYTKLQSDHAAFARQLEQVQAELKPLNEVRYWLSQVLGPEQLEVLDKTDGKRSVVEQLRKKDEQSKTSREEKSKEPTASVRRNRGQNVWKPGGGGRDRKEVNKKIPPPRGEAGGKGRFYGVGLGARSRVVIISGLGTLGAYW